jgi:hypothetical protein
VLTIFRLGSALSLLHISCSADMLGSRPLRCKRFLGVDEHRSGCSATYKLDHSRLEFSAVDILGWARRFGVKASKFTDAQKAFASKQCEDVPPSKAANCYLPCIISLLGVKIFSRRDAC